MNEDTSVPTPEEIYYAAEKYLPYLPSALQERVKTLLQNTKNRVFVGNEIISTFSEDERSRLWMHQALFSSGYDIKKDNFEKLAGNPTTVSASKIWICPKCNFKWHLFRVGRPIPNCPKDFSVLVSVDGDALT